MKQQVVPIDQAGRIVLPKEIRQELAIKPGDRFNVSINGLAVTLTPIGETTGFVRKGKALVFSTLGDEVLTDTVAEKILDSVRAERDSRNIEGLDRPKRRG